MKEKPFNAIKHTYVDSIGVSEYTAYHPVVRFYENEPYCYIPSEESPTGLIEYDNEKEALRCAEDLYKDYLQGKLE
ncbi:hypothetical protein [Bacillus sp. AK031]